ncbi:MAG: putative porin [Methylacidiphilales bacterium]|nr:putative porin [Candidatus Methylacidiphilales bacterium]
MLYPNPILQPKALILRIVWCCALVSGPAFADGTNAAPQLVTPAPIMAPTLQAQLRPVPPSDSGTPSSAPASTSSPSGTNATPAAPSGPAQVVNAANAPTAPTTDQAMTTPDLSAVAPPSPAAPPPPAASGDSSNAWKSAYVNLVNLLVNRSVLTKKDSGNLISQAEQAASAAPSQSQAAPATGDGDTMKVDYVPETVKEQMRDEIKQDVMQQARDEHWAAPDSEPDWVKRYHVSSDIRIRYEDDIFPTGNDVTSGSFINFNAINTGSPIDVISPTLNYPQYNVNQNRTRIRLRTRIGADIDVGNGFTAGLRVASGSDDSPVTENQTLGGVGSGQQGGDFSKYQIWLDRAFLKYQLGGLPNADFSVTVGRFDNPFFSSSMIWADEIGFDGLAVKAKYQVAPGVTPFLTGGAFPVYNTDLNFASDNASKFNSEDKWLYAVQGGATWQISHDFNFKGAIAYYDFENIQGQVSSPMDSTATAGNTDDSRPLFAQNGNTYIALRDIVTTDGGPVTSQPQYFGLASAFRELALTEQLDYSGFEPLHITLLGEFVKNLAFNQNAIENGGSPSFPGPINNRTGGISGAYVGGDLGYDVRLTVGHPTLEKLWDWNVNLTYRYVESDATVDGFTDADFGGSLTGTNLKGYIIGGNLGLTSRVWVNIRYMSSNAIAGPTYANDLIQFDLNAKF